MDKELGVAAGTELAARSRTAKRDWVEPTQALRVDPGSPCRVYASWYPIGSYKGSKVAQETSQ